MSDPDEALIEAIAEACGVTLSPAELTRFWSKVEKTSTCWLWTAGTCRGYGYFATARKNGRHGRSLRAHRVAFELLRGPISNGMQLDHLCRVRGCVNPDHLEVVTGATNTLRGISSPAINARKTHCRRGHEFTPENTYIDRGSRRCKACRRLIQNRWTDRGCPGAVATADAAVDADRASIQAETLREAAAGFASRTQEAAGAVREHWRGQDFVDGQDTAYESAAEWCDDRADRIERQP